MKGNDIRRSDVGENVSISAVITRFRKQLKLRRVLAFLSAVIMFFTMGTLRHEADTLERIPLCGLMEHQHDESCLDEYLQVTCGMDKHVHTDACYQVAPVEVAPVELPPVELEPMVLEEFVALGSQADAVDMDGDDAPEGLEPPVEETVFELSDISEATEDDSGLSIAYDEAAGEESGLSIAYDEAGEELSEFTYALNGSVAFLSDILNAVGMPITGISGIELDEDYIAAEPIEGIEGEYVIRVTRDFDVIRLGISSEQGVVNVYLTNGVAEPAAEGIAEEAAAELIEEAIPSEDVMLEEVAPIIINLDFSNYIATDEHIAYLYDATMVAVLVNADEVSSMDGVEATFPEDWNEFTGETAALVITGNDTYALNRVNYVVTGLALPVAIIEGTGANSDVDGDKEITIRTTDGEATLPDADPVFRETAEGYADIFSLFSDMRSGADEGPLARIVDTLLGGRALAEEQLTRTMQMKLFDIGLKGSDGEAVEPGSMVSITASFEPIEGEGFQLYHIVDSAAVLVENAVRYDEAGRAVGFDFEIDSLSPFALIYYTVTSQTGEVYTGYSMKVTENPMNAQSMLETLGIQAVADGVTCADERVVIDGLSIALPEADFEKALLVVTAGLNRYEITLLAGDELQASVGDYAVALDLSRAGLDESHIYKVEIQQMPATDADIAAVSAALSVELGNGLRKAASVSNLELVDISIQDVTDPEHPAAVEPAGEVAVSLTRNGEAVPTVIHFREDGTAEALDVVDGVFTTESFSAFTGFYTVDFHYEGVDFSIIGGSGVWLSALTEALGLDHIEGYAVDEVESVAFSDPALIDVIRSVNEYDEFDWLLRSLAAFDTEETLTITMSDGTAILVGVTDDQSATLANFLTDAVLYVDGIGHSLREGNWPTVYDGVDYNIRLSFAERGALQFPVSGDVLTMPVPAGLEIPVGTSATFDIDGGLAGMVTDNTFDVVEIDGQKCFRLTFGEDPYDILTRSSNTRFTIDINAEFGENVHHIHFTDSVDGEIDISNEGDATVAKTGTYNPNTGKMEYVLTVTSKGTTKNIRIKDTISGDTLTYDGNATIEPAGTRLSSPITTEGNGFALTIAQMHDGDTVTIRYTASVEYAGLDKYLKIREALDRKNSVEYTYDGEPDPRITDFSYDNEIRYSNIQKSNTNVADGETGQKVLTWKIVVNDNFRAPIVGGKITDQIAWDSVGAMKYSNPLVLTVVARDASGNQMGNTLSQTVTPWENDQTGQQGWEFEIPSFGEDDDTPLSYEITYTTVVETDKVPESGVVRNDSYNDHGGSSSGSGIIGKPDEPTINAVKTAKHVTDEYVDWDIVVSVPTDGFDHLTIVDNLPYHTGTPAGADTLAEENPITVVGLVGDEHWEMTTEQVYGSPYLWNADQTAQKARTRVTINFYQTEGTTQPGLLPNNPRVLTVTIRTKNDPEWMADAQNAHYLDTHTNNAKVNDYDVSASATPVLKRLEKKGNIVQDATGLFHYEIILSNVTKLPVVFDDYFDTTQFELVPTEDSYWGDVAIRHGDTDYENTIEVNNFPENTPTDYGFHTVINTLETKTDGSFYPYYHVNYYLKPKERTMAELHEEAIRNKGKISVGNTVTWEGVTDSFDIEYEVTGIDKDGWSHKDNDRLFDFMIDINPERLPLNDGEPMEMTDTHSANLNVDYHSIVAFKLPADAPVTIAAMKTAAKEGRLMQSYSGYVTDDITWNFSGNLGNFSGIEDATHYVIYYTALITGNDIQTFSNKADMEGFIDSVESTQTFTMTAEGASDVFELGLLKYQTGTTSIGLQGAKFQLFRGTGSYSLVDGSLVENKQPMTYGETTWTQQEGLVGKNITFTSDADGYVLLKLNETDQGNEFEAGVNYYLKEIESPAGFEVDGSVEYFQFQFTKDASAVNYGGTVNITYNGQTYPVRQYVYLSLYDIMKIGNAPTDEPLTINVSKEWLSMEGTPMSDTTGLTATVQLYQKIDDGAYQAVENTITNVDGVPYPGTITLPKDESWSYSWENLPQRDDDHRYAYKIEETAWTASNDTHYYASFTTDTTTGNTRSYNITNQQVEKRNTRLKVTKAWRNVDGTAMDAPDVDKIIFRLYRVVSKSPFTGTPTSGGTPYDAPSYDGWKVSDTTSDYYGLTGCYELPKEEYSTGRLFKNLPSVEVNGEDVTFYAYYVREIPVHGYEPMMEVIPETSEVIPETSGEATTCRMALTNRKLPEPIDLSVTKEWQYEDGVTMATAPDRQITFRLYRVASSEPFAERPTSGGVPYTHADDNGDPIDPTGCYTGTAGTYRLGHQAHVNPETWEYDESTSETGVWGVNFHDLHATSVDSRGRVTYYGYYIEEDVPEGFTCTVSNPDQYTLHMTNKAEPKYTSLRLNKVWLNSDGGASLRMDKTDEDAVTLDVYRISDADFIDLGIGKAIINHNDEINTSALRYVTLSSPWSGKVSGKLAVRDGDRIVVTVTKPEGSASDAALNPTVGYTSGTSGTWHRATAYTSTDNQWVFRITVDSELNNIEVEESAVADSVVEVVNASISSIQYELTQAEMASIAGYELTRVDSVTLNRSNNWQASLNNLLAESEGVKYTYFAVEPQGANHQAEYTIEGNTVYVSNRDKDVLEVDKRWFDIDGTTPLDQRDGTIRFTVNQLARTLSTVSITSDLTYSRTIAGQTPIELNVTGQTTGIMKGSTVTLTLTTSAYAGSSNDGELAGLDKKATPDVIRDNEDYNRTIASRTYTIKNIQSDVHLSGNLEFSADLVVTLDITVTPPAESVGGENEGAVSETELGIVELGTVTVAYDGIESHTLPYRVSAGRTPWSALIAGLPKSDATHAYTYAVEEAHVDGFAGTVTGAVSPNGTITITNTKEYRKDFSFSKAWLGTDEPWPDDAVAYVVIGRESAAPDDESDAPDDDFALVYKLWKDDTDVKATLMHMASGEYNAEIIEAAKNLTAEDGVFTIPALPAANAAGVDYTYNVREAAFISDGAMYIVKEDGVYRLDETKTATEPGRYALDGASIDYEAGELIPAAAPSDVDTSTGVTEVENWIVTQSGTALTNINNDTLIHIVKVWRENERVIVPTSDDCRQIQVTLWRKGGGTVAIDAETRQPVEDGTAATPFKLTVDQTVTESSSVIKSAAENDYRWDIAGLEQFYLDKGTLMEYEYYIIETAPLGWNVASYGNDTTAETDATPPAVVEYSTAEEARVKGEGTITITNSRFSARLPATGGSGTTIFYVISSALTLFIAALLLLRSRRSGDWTA